MEHRGLLGSENTLSDTTIVDICHYSFPQAVE